jgi:hypothetical protein
MSSASQVAGITGVRNSSWLAFLTSNLYMCEVKWKPVRYKMIMYYDKVGFIPKNMKLI